MNDTSRDDGPFREQDSSSDIVMYGRGGRVMVLPVTGSRWKHI